MRATANGTPSLAAHLKAIQLRTAWVPLPALTDTATMQTTAAALLGLLILTARAAAEMPALDAAREDAAARNISRRSPLVEANPNPPASPPFLVPPLAQGKLHAPGIRPALEHPPGVPSAGAPVMSQT